MSGAVLTHHILQALSQNRKLASEFGLCNLTFQQVRPKIKATSVRSSLATISLLFTNQWTKKGDYSVLENLSYMDECHMLNARPFGKETNTLPTDY